MPSSKRLWNLLPLSMIFFAARLSAADALSGPAFQVEPAALRQAADAIKAEKHDEATVLLNELNFTFDEAGRQVKTSHLIYRIENQEGVKDWAETSGRWDAWHQQKSEIKARVITADGSVHWLDPKTLNDVPVHEDAPDMYTDERRYGGPLPAVAPGAIVEEEVVTRDTAPLFAGGSVHRWIFGWNVAVTHTRIVLAHPAAIPFHYELHLLPQAAVAKSTESGVETITVDQGPLPAYTQDVNLAPADLVLYPEIEFSTGTSWKQVAAEYARQSEEKLRGADVQALLAKIGGRSGSRNDIIRRLVSALHKGVRYTGVEFGESSLIPQPPSETLKRAYGDCKDKAALLVAMLRGAGIPASLALLDAGPGRDINPNLPGIGMFDHAIVYVPASAGDPDLWLDATAEYSTVGTLPWMDYGRMALVVNEKTESLTRIPSLTSADNVQREYREVTLAEYGEATFVETDDEVGPEEADYRAYYVGDSKQVREGSESYVKEMYLAESLTSFEHNDLVDLQKPASIKFVAKGKRGNTDLTTALVAIRVESLFDRFPKYFRTKEKEEAPENDDSDKPKPRTADWSITPFTNEWHYKVTAPVGFRLRALPPDKDEKTSSWSFTQKYSSNADGTVVEALLRVESTNATLTAQQGKDLRESVLKARNVDPIFITFDSVGNSLITAGKIKEGLESYRQVAAQHPKEALHKVQLAQALLAAGLGEEARSVALEATRLEPKSALAYSTLGMVLKHDLIGRLLKKGMDYDGAAAAYRKTLELDPKDKESRANLGLMLEYDSNGTRYGDKAPLKDAVAVFRDLKKVDEEYARTYDDNVIYDFWYAHDYQGVLDYIATLPTSETRKGLRLAAIAILQGKDAALKKSLEITTDDRDRSKALADAGAVLVRVRKYQEGAALITEGAHGQNNESQIVRSAALFATTKAYDQIPQDSSDPKSVVHQLMGELLSGQLTFERFKAMTYIDATDDVPEEKDFQQMMSQLTSQMEATELPLVTIADLAVSNMHYTVDGDDALGYKIIVETPGAPAQDLFVIKDAGRYKVAAFSESGDATEELAPLILQALDKNNVTAARKWLDRAREKIHVSGGDDPLAGQPFPHFWTKGQEGDVAAMRTAALVLLRSKALKGPYFDSINQAREAAKTDLDRARLTMVLAYACQAQEKWTEMLPFTAELTKAFPTSVRAFELASMAFAGSKHFDDWEKLVQSRIKENPDELAYVRSSAQLAAYRGQYAKSREITKTIIDKGQAKEEDLNLYAWYALLVPGPIDQGAIDLASRASDLTKNENFAILHTLACVDAQTGKTSQARDLLLKALDAVHLEEPNSEIWFAFGLIAEQYGVADAAEKMYARVEKPKIEYPGASYAIAQQHLAALHSSAKPAGH